jgi:hypothetical protein
MSLTEWNDVRCPICERSKFDRMGEARADSPCESCRADRRRVSERDGQPLRAERIHSKRKAGMQYASIGAEEGISPSRVQQIFNQHLRRLAAISAHQRKVPAIPS